MKAPLLVCNTLFSAELSRFGCLLTRKSAKLQKTLITSTAIIHWQQYDCTCKIFHLFSTRGRVIEHRNVHRLSTFSSSHHSELCRSLHCSAHGLWTATPLKQARMHSCKFCLEKKAQNIHIPIQLAVFSHLLVNILKNGFSNSVSTSSRCLQLK